MKNEFAIAEVPTGELNAMVKNTMRQMKISDAREAVRRINSGEWVVSELLKPSILRLISGNKKIVIHATTGAKTIARAKDVFTWGIDSDFVNWGLDVPGEAKPETPVQVYEMVEDGDFKTIYGGLGRELDSLCFTQEQIITFAEDHKDWLRKDGYATFFLLKVNGEFFVAHVDLNVDERPGAGVYRFSVGYVWNAGDHHRFVVPQALES